MVRRYRLKHITPEHQAFHAQQMLIQVDHSDAFTCVLASPIFLVHTLTP